MIDSYKKNNKKLSGNEPARQYKVIKIIKATEKFNLLWINYNFIIYQ